MKKKLIILQEVKQYLSQNFQNENLFTFFYFVFNLIIELSLYSQLYICILFLNMCAGNNVFSVSVSCANIRKYKAYCLQIFENIKHIENNVFCN